MRRTALVLLALLLTSQLVSTSNATSPRELAPRTPNVLLIVTDDMRFDDLEYMPNVQRLLVDRGTSFSNFYVPFSLCCPARATLFSGQYPHNHGVLDNSVTHGGFPAFDDRTSLATLLDGRYTTGFVGKYLNGYGPATGSETYVPPGWDDWRGGDWQIYSYLHTALNQNGTVVDYPGRYATEVVGEQTRSFMAAATAGGGEPFLSTSMFVAPHHGAPHGDDPQGLTAKSPFVSRQWRGSYTGPLEPASPAFNEVDTSDKRDSFHRHPLLTQQDLYNQRVVMRQRREALLAVDAEVQQFVQQLRAEGVLGDTVIVFTSDNGRMQGEHRLFPGKTSPYEEASRLPLVIRGPGVPRGATVDGMAGMQDLAPTLVEMAGMTEQVAVQGHVFDGRSLTPMFTDAGVNDRRTLLLEDVQWRDGSRVGEVDGDDRRLRRQTPQPLAARSSIPWSAQGVVERNWKLIHFVRTDEWELYHLKSDPYELANVSGQPRYAAKESRLRGALRQLRNCRGDNCN